MIRATVSSWSCFCWLYTAFPPVAAKNIINLISVLTIWWCPCVESSLVLLEEGVCYDSAFSWQNSISLCPASFRIPRPNLPVTPGDSWLPTFAFQSPIRKRTSFLGVSSKRSCRSSSVSSVQSLRHVRPFVTPWIAAPQASLSINSWSSLKLTSIESVMSFSHLILCCPLLLLPPIPPSIRVFSNESTLCIR